jgi:hypothetical protein
VSRASFVGHVIEAVFLARRGRMGRHETVRLPDRFIRSGHPFPEISSTSLKRLRKLSGRGEWQGIISYSFSAFNW